MHAPALAQAPKIIVIDDNVAIHEDFRKIFAATRPSTDLNQMQELIFGTTKPSEATAEYDLDFALQGHQGWEMVRTAIEVERPYALAFVDMRMPPGWDGLETIERLWEAQPDLQIVICTAYSDYSWSDLTRRLRPQDRLLILKKPFDNVEVCQLAAALTEKFYLASVARLKLEELELLVDLRTVALHQEIAERKRSEEALREAEARTRVILDTAPAGIITINQGGLIETSNGAAERMFGSAPNELLGTSIADLIPSLKDHCIIRTDEAKAPTAYTNESSTGLRRNKEEFPIDVGLSELRFGNRILHTVIVRDMSEQKRLEVRLSQAQKLEAMGQLAAGIAHEINTPAQYITDNTRFLQEAFAKLCHLFVPVNLILEAAAEDRPISKPLTLEVRDILEQADLKYLLAEIPVAIEQSIEGINRVTHIVGSMREFSHPDTVLPTLVDLNKSILNSLSVARHEWRYIARLETHLDPDLPLVLCVPGEINQVFLNLIVNASHAISDAVGREPSRRGEIRVDSRKVGNSVEVRVSDNGDGIPLEIRSRIFDPFFTTKVVGRGTGQGLAIAHNVIVNKHGGVLNFETEAEKGSTFIVSLPIGPA